MNLKPCPFCQVDDEGHILCEKIKSGDREVSPNVCRVCPVAQINCAHLRATLNHQARPPLTVRYGNGKTEIWDDPAPPIALQRAACAAKVISILSPRDCAGCSIHQAPVSVDAVAMPAPRVAPAPANAARAIPPLGAEPRANIVAQKIIQLQEWLSKQKDTPPEKGNADDKCSVLPIAVGAERVRPVPEEKRVGWTD